MCKQTIDISKGLGFVERVVLHCGDEALAKDESFHLNLCASCLEKVERLVLHADCYKVEWFS